MAGHLVRDDDKQIYGDAGYTGMANYLGEKKNDPTRCLIAAKRGAIERLDDSPMKALLLAIERTKDSIRDQT